MDPAARRAAARRFARNVVRALEAIDQPLWILSNDHELIFINAPAVAWLGIVAEDFVGRQCHVAIERHGRSDSVAAALAPPLGLEEGSLLVAIASPPDVPARRMRYLKLGQGRDRIVLAIGTADEHQPDRDELEIASQLRDRLNQWRRQQIASGLIVTAGSSAAAMRLRQQVLLACATRQHLGISGPRGCGSEAIARRIHAAPLAAGLDVDPIVTVDTPLMDAELLEATLSPAAAHLRNRSQGNVTLILRSVDESPLDVQQRITDFVLQHGSAVRLIGLLANPASQRSEPAALTAQMTLALSVLELVVAPLVSRSEDIALIASALVDSRHAAGASVAERISRTAQDRLVLYPWPGNFDELESAIRHATSTARSAAIQPEDLPLAVRSYRFNPSKRRHIVNTTLDDAMRSFELEKIHEAMDVADGNRSEAARLLGISRGRLIRRLEGSDSSSDGASRDDQDAPS